LEHHLPSQRIRFPNPSAPRQQKAKCGQQSERDLSYNEAGGAAAGAAPWRPPPDNWDHSRQRIM
jgi:hypothetical protein